MLKNFLKYLRVYKTFLKTSFISDAEFRANFVSRVVTDSVWYLAQILVFETLYSHYDRIGGLTIHQ
jgi:ABC-2 type transport system permease protein